MTKLIRIGSCGLALIGASLLLANPVYATESDSANAAFNSLKSSSNTDVYETKQTSAETGTAVSTKFNTFVYGESLTEDQKAEIRGKLGVAEGASELVVNVSELNGLLNNDVAYKQVVSSIYMVSNETGVEVKIMTPETITEVSEYQYKNAAITAGIKNVTIYVASPKKVDGSGALAGVFKAYKNMATTVLAADPENKEFVDLDEESVKIAQNELELTMSIDSETKEDSKYESGNLNDAMASMKIAITEKRKTVDKIERPEIEEIVTAELVRYKLEGIISPKNKTAIVDLMVEFANTESDVQAETTQLKSYSTEAKTQGDTVFTNIKSTPGQKVAKVNVFESIKQYIFSFFK